MTENRSNSPLSSAFELLKAQPVKRTSLALDLGRVSSKNLGIQETTAFLGYRDGILVGLARRTSRAGIIKIPKIDRSSGVQAFWAMDRTVEPAPLFILVNTVFGPQVAVEHVDWGSPLTDPTLLNYVSPRTAWGEQVYSGLVHTVSNADIKGATFSYQQALHAPITDFRVPGL